VAWAETFDTKLPKAVDRPIHAVPPGRHQVEQHGPGLDGCQAKPGNQLNRVGDAQLPVPGLVPDTDLIEQRQDAILGDDLAHGHATTPYPVNTDLVLPKSLIPCCG